MPQARLYFTLTKFMRKHWIDNLRWATVLLVLLYHVVYFYISPSRWRVEGDDFYFSGYEASFRMELLEAKGDGCGEERELAERIVKKVSGSIGRETKFNMAKLTKDELVWSYTYKDGHTDTWEFYR